MKAQMSFTKTTEEVGKMIVAGTSNWDYYAIESFGNKKVPYCFAVAKPDSTAGTSCFGDLYHICNLIKEDTFEGEFTAYGRELMMKYGYENYLNQYEEIKDYVIQFYDTSRWYGNLTRTVVVKSKSRSEAYSKAYMIRTDGERDITVNRKKTESNKKLSVA